MVAPRADVDSLDNYPNELTENEENTLNENKSINENVNDDKDYLSLG